jgi:hypothetical protein
MQRVTISHSPTVSVIPVKILKKETVLVSVLGGGESQAERGGSTEDRSSSRVGRVYEVRDFNPRRELRGVPCIYTLGIPTTFIPFRQFLRSYLASSIGS